MTTAQKDTERWALYEVALKQSNEDGHVDLGLITENGLGQGPFHAEREGKDLVLATPRKRVVLETLDPACMKGLEEGAGLFVINLKDDDIQPVNTPWG
jgi:hypothetical protein